ncbi:hypothetical protein [Nocardioides panzhihuensis]|uniref:Uncharacterized protein n=1 Tax=Nocardioides panzhihuensis TaxID=860243 RepID=A0A7Z0DK66_9ACTN|nr:hypothetical protein [Nocardioides panzhihuensis]NYI77129.1 hypothetical protein [Nocardioides panzhihuensis]
MLSLMVMIGFLAIVVALGAVAVLAVRSGHGDHATDRDGDGVPYDDVDAVGRTKAEEERARAGGLDSLGDAGGPSPSTAEVQAARRLDEETRRRRDRW